MSKNATGLWQAEYRRGLVTVSERGDGTFSWRIISLNSDPEWETYPEKLRRGAASTSQKAANAAYKACKLLEKRGYWSP